jgi:hypothetical protein
VNAIIAAALPYLEDAMKRENINVRTGRHEPEVSDIDPLAQHEAEREERKLRMALTDNTRDVAAHTRRVAELRHAYDIKYAQEYLRTSGTIPERKAKALLALENENLELELAKGLLSSARNEGHNIRKQLDMLQSIMANIRDHVRNPYGQGG